MEYDREGNVIVQTDAKNKDTELEFDPLGRQVKIDNRLGCVTTMAYDPASNVVAITDAQNKTTEYEYNSRGLKEKEIYPDHNPTADPGDTDYGIVEFDYYPSGRLKLKTDQDGDTVTFNYDLAGRMEQRDYRLEANLSACNAQAGSPSGTIADSDVFTYDRVGRMLTAVSGRYGNEVTHPSPLKVSRSHLFYLSSRLEHSRG